MSEVLMVKDLCRTYFTNANRNEVLKNISFIINEGEIVAVMGPSGSGKSTLLYNVSGMDRPTSGEVWLKGKELNGLPEEELADIRLNRMGFIFQQMQMLSNLNILDNILLPAYRSKKEKRSREEINRYAGELMQRLSVSEIADSGISEVSGGQLQRACICRSMINRPDILFADEPTGALNRSASDGVIAELLKLNEEGTTIMLVTHDSRVASRCTRILYIIDGNIRGELVLGSSYKPEDIKRREKKVNQWLAERGW